ncbi:hypothetical protein [Pleionea sediminis]|uniref:hypothetical protein n=1 Tax=Pleionea sediminis TaxID=2569479 RepID=UPI0011863130|nr:hypothetical protein [Pleionea sediminis]
MYVKKQLFYFLLVIILSLLSACVSNVRSIKYDSDLKLETTEGYLLLAVETNVDLKSIHILGAKNIKLNRSDLLKGSNYILVDMPAGDYRIDKITMSSWLGYQYVKLDEEYWSFTIQPGVISYAGHVNVKSSIWSATGYFELNNKSSYALEYMEQEFPNIMANRTLVYEGPGEDGFLDFIDQRFMGGNVE